MSRAVILKEDNEQILPVTDIALVQGMSAAVVHKTGNQTIAGTKSFSGMMQIDGGVQMNGNLFEQTETIGFSWLREGNGDSVQDFLDGKEDESNKVTSISSSSTDTQYPSAKCVYDLIGDVEALILAL